MRATARAMANIAFIKYWGNTDDELRLPANSSLSMNLRDLYTETTVQWDETLEDDELVLNGDEKKDHSLTRVSKYLDHLRKRLNLNSRAHVNSQNNFPMGVGIASSASAFAALTLAAVRAAGEESINEQELSTLARLGSGSAARSIPGGFVKWYAGERHETSYAECIAPPEHWDLVDVIAIVSKEHKKVGSQAGHPSAATSDLQDARVAGAANRLNTVESAILERDFITFADVVEEDSNLMHAIMMTSQPPLFYWEPATLTIMKKIRDWRIENGLQVCYTLDAGPNVHCICIRKDSDIVRDRLRQLSGVLEVRSSPVGPAAYIVDSDQS